MKHYQVKNINSGAVFTVNEGESILSAALRQGVMLPYSCKNGTCGSCKGKLESGDVHYPFHPPLALNREEIGEGCALLCQAEPTEDLEIRVREIEAVRDLQVRKMPARVIEKSLLAADVMRLKIKLPSAQRLQFLAGQYLEILLPEDKRRAFSIASAPHSEDIIELHIRHVEGGGFTGWVFDELKVRDILRLEAPLGTFFVRNDRPERPMIMMGGGTGFAPLKSMIEDLLSHNDKRPLHLFWGARNLDELYMHEQAQQWADENPHIQFSSAVMEPANDGARATFDGYVHEAVLQQYPDLSGFDIYMSGPPAMVDTGRAAFIENGAKERRIFFDSFEFGLDVPVRVLAKSH
ncbi:MAG: CDP-6-deoxy-delta-3,4-glucoseen reductase [Xanthomonadales bacterium]|nr:CDP-6-deoxy-delta-3,4-glucoseen reductase [Gammaproteobacteria bacterium]MBT8072663.1 CDP-6-deoxy-delta-3,4-glucoseen reductase [Gammaproteobacteria bacterium]NNK03504.1 CDP-6-deoxy-delta-3,4-glucoseen reductase [Xanthomonadales bacterium]NNK98337.1 CDP-6-deoxy-delta-3,4-glucoseen reductase [Xanthomonadales bacterium]